MKFPHQILFAIIIFGCGQNNSGKPAIQDSLKKTNSNISDSTKIKDSISAIKSIPNSGASSIAKKELLNLSEKILKSIKDRNYSNLAKFIHPKSGVRFSLYAYVDTISDQVISVKKIIELGNNHQKIRWGITEGEELLNLSIDGYFKRFVYDADFLNAEKRSVNEFLGAGNSLNNLRAVYPDSDFTEFYFPGFDPKYEGMDWRTLRLVFKKYQNKNYLVGVIHDEWTI